MSVVANQSLHAELAGTLRVMRNIARKTTIASKVFAAHQLAIAYNRATNPAKLRSDEEHAAYRRAARVLRQLKRRHSLPIAESDNGAWYVPR